MIRFALARAVLATTALVGCVNETYDEETDAPAEVVESDAVDPTSYGTRPGPMPCPRPGSNGICPKPVKK